MHVSLESFASWKLERLKQLISIFLYNIFPNAFARLYLNPALVAKFTPNLAMLKTQSSTHKDTLAFPRSFSYNSEKTLPSAICHYLDQ
jgi:hypothetical protein